MAETKNKFRYCPQCESDKITETDYEIIDPDCEDPDDAPEYIVDDDGRACDDCNWEGDVTELVCKDDD